MKGSNLAAFFGGVIVGGIVAVLLAPESGEQTRSKIKNFVDKEIDDVKRMSEELKGKLHEAADRCKCREGEECTCTEGECTCEEPKQE